MKKAIILLMLCLVLPNTARANPFNMANVSADANWVVHADFDLFRNTEFGKLFRARLDELGISEKLDNFAKVFSFNPLNDVRDVTIYGQDKDEHKTAILINGKFDQERLLALLRLNPEYGEEVYEGITLRRWHDDKKGGKMMYGCFYTDNLVVMSSGEDIVKRAIDVLKSKAGHTDAMTFNQPALSDGTAFIKIASRDLDGLAKTDKQQSFITKQIQSLSAAAGETGQQFYVNATLQARSAEAAGGINKMIEGLVTLAALGGEENGELSEIAKKIQVACENSTVRIRLSDSPQAIFEMVAQHMGKNAEKQ
jgi:hypothetical protein